MSESSNEATVDGDHGESSEAGPNTEEKEKKRRSKIFDHFTWSEKDASYKCNYSREGSYKKNKIGTMSTSGMLSHMKSKHPSRFLKEDQEATTHLRTFLGIGAPEKFTKEGFMKRMLSFIILTDQPFTITENDHVRKLFKYCNPAATLPTGNTIRQEIRTLYNEQKQALKEILKLTPGKLSFVIDCWTSANQWPFQGIIVQWVTEDWEIRQTLLDLTCLEGSHTGKNLSKYFTDVLQDFDILKKFQALTSDNASNMDTFCVEFSRSVATHITFDSKNQRVRCLAHIMNLACKTAIEKVLSVPACASFDRDPDGANADSDSDVQEDIKSGKLNTILGKLKISIQKIRASPQRRETFRMQCHVANKKVKELINSNSTRWNSTYDMLCRALELKDPLTCTLRSERKLSKFVIEEEDWSKIQYILELLLPFKKMTLLMSKQKFASVSFCALVYSTLFKHLECYLVDQKRKLKGVDPKTGDVYAFWLQTAAQAAYTKLDEYYPTSDGLVYVVATVLDPRCKLNWYKDAGLGHEIITGYRKDITKAWEQTYKIGTCSESVSDGPSASSTKDPAEDIFLQQMKKRKVDEKDELQRYLSEPAVRADTLRNGSLGWWKLHEADYPNLARMARDFLSVSGTGVPIERAFSGGTDLLSPKRLSMKPETIQQCMCLKFWLKQKENEEFGTELSRASSYKIFEKDPIEFDDDDD